MKIVYGLFIPIFLLTLGACKKPVLEITDGSVPPMVLMTAIEDSLPAKTITALNLHGLTGLKIQYYSGLHNSYFEYDANKDLLLDAISALPFPMNAGISDTRCRQISFRTFHSVRKNISATETESTIDFWNTADSEYQRFECVKPPYRHILQIENGTDHILHRIELLEQS
jgi:hypothetical protein